ncbi:alpha/beta hydrolase [Pseudonocardiaceae bacterium YIM PH 21723]|nr:alpha/beta hydrolase [Pseudonocardiaceae bacterium YIM PH 21723]
MTPRARSGARWLVAGLSAVALSASLIAPVQATPTDGLAEFYGQSPTWAPCDTKGELAKLDCATIAVPLNYRAPDQERISVTISRLKAKDASKRRGVLLLNPGGPGGDGIGMPAYLAAQRVSQNYDLIGFDPRGVGRSTPLNCEVSPFPEGLSTRPADSEFPKWTEMARANEEGCANAAGGIRPYINTPNTARDMDVIRGVLGEKKINYLGYSYGTYLGAVYGSLFPAYLDRNVLDSSVHPEWLWREQFKQQAVGALENVTAWSGWAAQYDARYHLGTTQDAVLATLNSVALKLRERKVDDGSGFDAAIGSYTRYREAWLEVADLVVKRKAEVDGAAPANADAIEAQRLMAQLGIPQLANGVFETVTCEADWPRDLNAYYADMRQYRQTYPWGFGVLRAAPWNCAFRSFTPADPLTNLERKGYPTGLVIQAENDAQTQYDGGPAMARRLNDNLVSVADDGTHGMYAYNKCASDIIDRYLIDGVLPGSSTVCTSIPRPTPPAQTQQQSSLTERVTKINEQRRSASPIPQS